MCLRGSGLNEPLSTADFQLVICHVGRSGTRLPYIPHFLAQVFSFTTKNIWRTRNIWILPEAKTQTNQQANKQTRKGQSWLCARSMSALNSPVHEHAGQLGWGQMPSTASQGRRHSPALGFASWFSLDL